MPTLRSALLLALLTLGLAAPARATPPMWVVRDADSEMVLFGAVHMLPRDLAWSPPALAAAVKSADDIWFESPADGAADAGLAKAARAGAFLPEGTSLSSLLPGPDAERLAAAAKAYDIDPSRLERLKPWMAEVLLTEMALARTAGAYAEYGVEPTLNRLAPPNVRRRSFASTDEHLALFEEPAAAEQLRSLGQTLRTLDNTTHDYEALLQAWMAGDLEGIEQRQVEPLRRAAPDAFRRLVSERNARWARLLDQRLKGHGRSVVVVGLGHLVGPGSLPDRLRALGYSVTGP